MPAPIHVVHRVAIKATKDTSGTQKLIDRDETQTFDQYQEGGSSMFTLPPSTTDFVVPMLSINDAQLVCIEVDGLVTVKINGITNDPISIRPNPTLGSTGRLMLDTTGVTSLHITNPSTSTAVRVWYCLCGD